MAENVGKHLEQKESKQKKAKKPSRLTKGQKWLLAVAIVLAVVLVAVVALDGLFVKPELPGKGNGSNADGTQAGDGIDYGDGVQPRVSGERKSKDYYTVLILGRDTGGGGNTDTMLLASYDVTNPEGQRHVHSPGHHGKRQLGREEDQLRLQHERRRGEGHQGPI